MARNRKYFGKKTKESNATQRSIATAQDYAAVAGVNIPDHELTTFSPANMVRRFDIDEPSNGPSIIYREVNPYAAYNFGYSEGVISDQDTSAAVDTTVADPKTALNPITDMAVSFEQDVFPILLNVFASGTGKRYEVTINEVVRVIAMGNLAYQRILQALTFNKLTYHTDWTKVAPFSGVVPSHLYKVCENLDITDVGLAQTWLPRMRRMENLTMFPRMLAETKRMMTPMMSIDLHGRVQVPTMVDPSTIDADTQIEAIDDLLDYIDSTLADAANLMATFLPFPMLNLDPWNIPDLPTLDVDRDSGWYNSGVKNIPMFGDTSDPTKQETMLFDEADSLRALFFTRHCQPIWSEIKLSTIYWLEDHLSDDTFKIVTPHKYKRVFMIDDAFDSLAYDGTALTTSDDGFRYISYVNSRFAGVNIDYGIQKPGTFGAWLDYSAVQRMMRLETSWAFSVDALKLVTANMAGSSLREIRSTIQGLVFNTLIGGK
jgi:hypothetical protein